MVRAHVLGKLALEFRDTRSLTNPATSEHFDNSLLFIQPEGRSSYGNRFQRHRRTHDASTADAAVALPASLQRISSRRPCSNGTMVLKSSILSAFSTAARRLCTFPTLRASRYSGCNGEPESLRSNPHSSFRLVWTPVPTLKTSSLALLCAANRFARATSST